MEWIIDRKSGKSRLRIGRTDFVEAAKGAATFLLANLRREDDRWLHVWREGKAEIAGFLDDYAYLANGWFDLGIATGDVVWIDEAIQLVDKMVDICRRRWRLFLYCQGRGSPGGSS